MSAKKMGGISILVILGLASFYFMNSHTNIIGSYFNSDWHPMGSGFYRGHMMMGGVMHFIFWLILFFFLVSAIDSRKASLAYSSDSAVEILRKKYVSGEINQAEYTEKLEYLNRQ